MVKLNELYVVFICPKCGSVRYSKSKHKKALCFNCGYQISIDPSKIRILFRTSKREKAMEAVKEYKMKLGKKSSKSKTILRDK